MPADANRTIPNPESTLLKQALIGGVGLGSPVEEPPAGYASIVLFVPADAIVGKTIFQVQSDMGMPWTCTDEKGSTTGVFLEDIAPQQAAG